MDRKEIVTKAGEKICAFTGHRTLGEDFSFVELDEAICAQLKKGVRVFLNGVAVGFDLMAAELLLSHIEEYPDLRLIACIPCEEQYKFYSPEDKIRYYNVLAVAEKVILSSHYFNGCMQMRDEFMAKRADTLITYCKKKKGGTAYTVRQFLKHHPSGEVFYL